MAGVEWLRDLLNHMQDDIHEIKKDVKKLNEFKFRMIGASGAISAIVAVIVSIVVAWIGKS